MVRMFLLVFLVKYVIEVGVVFFAWNLGVAPMFHLGVVDWAGAFSLRLLLTVARGITVTPFPKQQVKRKNEQPPKTL